MRALATLAMAILIGAPLPLKAQEEGPDPSTAPCWGESEASGIPAKVRREYPFDVARIQGALNRLSLARRPLRVLIVDNAFAGYVQEAGTWRPTPNFPEEFFFLDEATGRRLQIGRASCRE